MGVNPPFLKLYIRRAMKALKGIEGKRGLDKIFPKLGKPRTKLCGDGRLARPGGAKLRSAVGRNQACELLPRGFEDGAAACVLRIAALLGYFQIGLPEPPGVEHLCRHKNDEVLIEGNEVSKHCSA